jgi:hypothetical protein
MSLQVKERRVEAQGVESPADTQNDAVPTMS